MRVMYIAPRFHTNQSAVVKGWIERGDTVTFISYYTAIIEDYTYVKPIVLGFSPLYYLIDYLYVNVFRRNDLNSITLKINYGFPPIFRLRKELKKANPDIVIMRDRTLYTIVAYWFCKRYGYSAILYNQSPLWEMPSHRNFLHRLVRKWTPSKRMTPVTGQEEEGKQIEENSFFVPFVVEPKVSPEDKDYFAEGKMEILSIGKFEPRKHHIMMIEVVSELAHEFENIHLTIIGEATGRFQKEHLSEVREYVTSHNLEQLVDIQINVPRQKTDDYYKKTDIFVIPSTREMASISQLEAMSFSIPVIISDKNGSVGYVEDGKNGFHFEDNNKESLKEKLRWLLKDKTKIKEMGKCSYQLVTEKYTFMNYYQAVMRIVQGERQ